jgi:HD-GYP domain-containing protein (c-di-GMP phosphodiesterase class II)
MSPIAERPGLSPSAIASSWLDHQLVSVLSNVRQRLRMHVFLTSSGTALISGIGAFSISAMGSSIGTWHTPGAVNATVLAVAASIMTAAALYPVLHQRERWLHRAISTITHDNIDLLSVLGKVTELRNGETAGHNLRVTLYTLLFAEALDLPPEEIVRSVKGALLHDVGKLAVPDRILGKPGPLALDERAEMAKHVRYGLEIIWQSHVLQDAAPVVGAHHEHYDGQGYPLGLKGEAIPREARLFALVDVFDALTSSRVYKAAFSVEEALTTMAAGRGTHFDPTLFDRFVAHAPDLARSLPKDEPALAALLMERLLPYFELFVLGRAMLASPDAWQAFEANQVSRDAACMPTATAAQPTPAGAVTP